MAASARELGGKIGAFIRPTLVALVVYCFGNGFLIYGFVVFAVELCLLAFFSDGDLVIAIIALVVVVVKVIIIIVIIVVVGFMIIFIVVVCFFIVIVILY